MNPEQQRIEIAKWCGWKSHHSLPDYLNDQSAMNDVEINLSSNQWELFHRELSKILPEDNQRMDCATAA